MKMDIILLTRHYNYKSLKKTREIKKCILANAFHFKYIVVLFENWEQVENNQEYKYLTDSSSNIKLVKIDSFQFYNKDPFKLYFEYAYKNYKDNFVVISHNNTLFDHTLNKIFEIDMKNSLIALTRLQPVDKNNLCSLFTFPCFQNLTNNRAYSYAFKPSLLNFDICDTLPSLAKLSEGAGPGRDLRSRASQADSGLGNNIIHADTTLMEKLCSRGIVIKNPGYNIKTYHIDFTNEEQDLATIPPGRAGADCWCREVEQLGQCEFQKSTLGEAGKSQGPNSSVVRKGIYVISYCLWGTNEKYYQNIERNISDSLEFYPDMIVVLIIHESSVDLERLKCLDDWPNVAIIKSQEYYGTVLNMTWRFEILDNPHIDLVLSRDLDSLILKREVLAVREWLKSSKRVHIMRDHPCHSYKMLGGMIGIKKIPYLETMSNIISKYKSRCNEFEIDQKILRAEIYPMCCAMNDVYVHASFHAHEIFAQPFPIEWDDSYHFVGAYLENDGTPQKYVTDMIKNNTQKEWIRGTPHKDVEVIRIDDAKNIFEAIQTYKLKNKSYCFFLSSGSAPRSGRVDEIIDKLIKNSYDHDDEKILIDDAQKWIIFHSKVLHDFLASSHTSYLEKTGNIITYKNYF